MAYFRSVWLMSTICASRQIENITPRQTAAAPSSPKSVRKLMNGRSIGRSYRWGRLRLKGHALLVLGKVRPHAERVVDARGEGRCRVGIAVHEEHRPRPPVVARRSGRPEVPQPAL